MDPLCSFGILVWLAGPIFLSRFLNCSSNIIVGNNFKVFLSFNDRMFGVQASFCMYFVCFRWEEGKSFFVSKTSQESGLPSSINIFGSSCDTLTNQNTICNVFLILSLQHRTFLVRWLFLSVDNACNEEKKRIGPLQF